MKGFNLNPLVHFCALTCVTGRSCGSVALWSECSHSVPDVLGSSPGQAMCFFLLWHLVACGVRAWGVNHIGTILSVASKFRDKWQNEQNDLSAQLRLISLGICWVWSVLAVRMKKHWALNYILSTSEESEDSDQTGGWQGWSECSLGARYFVGFVVWRLKWSLCEAFSVRVLVRLCAFSTRDIWRPV